MKQYLLGIVQPDGPTPPPEVLGKVMQEVGVVMGELKAAGAWVFNAGLHPPSSATVVRWKEGEALTTDGPYAEAKEQLGGFIVVAARDLDGALGWARKFARAIGLPIEVRPIRQPGERTG